MNPSWIPRRRLLTGGAAVAGLSMLPACTREKPPAGPSSVPATKAAPTTTGTVNVRVSNDQYGVHIEPSVAVNPRNPRQLLAACQASPSPNPEFIATYISADAGATWRPGALPRLSADPQQDGDDVTVAFDAHGRGYVCADSTAGGRGVYVWRTDDGGRTFSAPVTVVSGEHTDHPWLATGAGPTPAQPYVHVVWGAGKMSALSFSRSTDGGATFEAPRTILGDESSTPDISPGAALAAGPNGLVCIVCDRVTSLDTSGEGFSQVVAVCSTDGGGSFGPPVMLGKESPIISLPGGVIPDSSPAVAAGADGALYAAFTRHQPGAAHSDLVVTASHDGGRTWSPPTVATPADDAIYFQPNLAVDSAGHLAISAFALARGRVDVVVLISAPKQLRFGPPRRVTTAPFDPANSPTEHGKHGAWWIGDYQGIASGDGRFHVVWNDTRTGKLELFAAAVTP
jgi:hypothetical protein